MSYRVEYGWDMEKRFAPVQSRRRVLGLSLVFFGIFLTLVHLFWADGREVLWKLVFPGNAVVTWNALEDMAYSLRQGKSLISAAECFCREIMLGY